MASSSDNSRTPEGIIDLCDVPTPAAMKEAVSSAPVGARVILTRRQIQWLYDRAEVLDRVCDAEGYPKNLSARMERARQKLASGTATAAPAMPAPTSPAAPALAQQPQSPEALAAQEERAVQIKQGLESPDTEVAMAVIPFLSDLAKVNPSLAAPLFLQALQHEEVFVRMSAVIWLDSIAVANPDLAIPLFQKVLQDENVEVQRRAAAGLNDVVKGYRGVAASFSRLIQELIENHPDNIVRMHAQDAAANMPKRPISA